MKTRWLLFTALFINHYAIAEDTPPAAAAPYLLPGAPTFEQSISQFRKNSTKIIPTCSSMNFALSIREVILNA